MDLKQLKASGAFVSEDLEKRTIEWTHAGADGNETTDEVDVFIRRVSFGAAERIFQNEDSTSCELIAQCVRLGEDGKEQLTHEQAAALEPRLASALVDAVSRVNRLGDDAPKN